MTKSKGRFAREKGLPKLTGGPELPAEGASQDWAPPRDVLVEEYRIIFDDENRMFIRLAIDGPQLADFCVSQQMLVDGQWKDVVRFDCAHGTIHAHYLRRDGSEMRRREVMKISGFADIRDGYDEACDVVVSKWTDHARRF
jgi:hypothetical protein